MDLLKLMRSFVAVADSESFSRAARSLGVSPAAVTRDVAALEAHLGARLLTRTTRQVRVTPEGSVYLRQAKRIAADILEAETSIRDRHGELVGPVSVTAPAAFGQLHVAPLLLSFAQQHPQIVVTALLLDRVVDLTAEGVDVAVRIAHLTDSQASASKIGSVRRRLCASPKYLAKHGEPKSVSDVANHAAITTSQQPLPWRLYTKGRAVPVYPRLRFAANSIELAITAAESDLGLVWLYSYQVEASIAAGRLRPLLVECEPPGTPIHVVHMAGQSAPQRTRALIEHLVSGLRKRKIA